MNKGQDLMKRSTQFAVATLLAAGLSLVGVGCQSDGQVAGGATTMPDHAKGDHPKGDHPKGDHAKGDHAKGDHPKGDHPKGDHPKGDHPD